MSAHPTTRPPAQSEAAASLLVYLTLAAALWESRERQGPPAVVGGAVAFSDLRGLGVGHRELLWLIHLGHVAHLDVRSGPPRPAATLTFGEDSAFVLTPDGEAGLDCLLEGLLSGQAGPAAGLLGGEPLPRFDREARALTWGPFVVKTFRQPAENQIRVLSAAEELRWPLWFDDPLPRQRGKRSQERLHDTIKALNRFQHPSLIRFKGDGTGTRVGWEYR